MRALCSLLVLVAACDRPRPLVLCHNANCGSAPDVSRDDTIEAMEESLALGVIDGIEIDSVWDGATDTCVFAHDLTTDARVPATDAADVLAAWLVETGAPTPAGEPFVVMLELKGHVDPAEAELHSEAQLAAHAACVWEMHRILSEPGVEIEFIVSSFEPRVLRAVREQEAGTVRYGGIFGIPAPLDGQTHPLSDYAGTGIDLMEVHAQWINDAQHEAIRSSGLDLAFWMFSATSETFATIEQYEPTHVVTNEAELMRRWLEY